MSTLSPATATSRTGASTSVPHLSHSRINRFLHCPEQYRLYYVENVRPKTPDATLLFGRTIHQALEALFRNGTDPVTAFADAWDPLEDTSIRYKSRESWEILNAKGIALLEKFVADELTRIGEVRTVEKSFELSITGFDSPFLGVIDLIADFDGTPTVIDFKTSASAYAAHEVALSDQLTAYQLAEPQIEQTALCVLVKTKEPKIEWHTGRRGPADLLEYFRKANLIASAITAGQFYRRPGRWCAYCDYLPICTGDEHAASETLIRINPSNPS